MAHRGMVRFQIGKNGLTENFIDALRKTFKNRKMIKITLLRSYSRDREEVKRTAEKICSGLLRIGNFKYKIIGFTITLIKWRK